MSPPDPRFARHLHRLLPRLHRAAAGRRVRPDALALVAVETYYRPLPARLGEYLLWALLSLGSGEERLGRLSLGPGQVQLRHWRAAGLLDGLSWRPRRLLRVASLGANLEAVEAYLERHRVAPDASPQALTRRFTGGDRPGFAPRLAAARQRLGAGG